MAQSLNFQEDQADNTFTPTTYMETPYDVQNSMIITTKQREKGKFRLQYNHVINLQALITATNYIDSLLNTNQQVKENQLIHLNLQNIQHLYNPFNIHELLSSADALLLKMNKTEQQRNNQQQTEQQPIKFTYQFIQQLLSKNKADEIYTRSQLFQNPLSPIHVSQYYQKIKHPMCFLFIILRIKQTQLLELDYKKETPYFAQHDNPLLFYDNQQYGSMLDQATLFSALQSKSVSELQQYIHELELKPHPYACFGEVLTDLLLICCNCCYYNINEDQYLKQGQNLFNDIRQLSKKHQLWNDNYDQVLKVDFLKKINETYSKTDFDKLNIDDLSEQTLKDLISTLDITDNSVRRQNISVNNMQKCCQLIKEKGLLHKQNAEQQQRVQQQSQLDFQDNNSLKDYQLSASDIPKENSGSDSSKRFALQ